MDNTQIAAELFARFSSGDIQGVLAYLDTQHAFEVWVRP